jgi:nucleotide-binding universal stress UspA family protein
VATGEADFPRAIVAGVDGSPESAAAAEAALDLGGRLGADVRLVAARGGKQVDLEAASGAPLQVDDRHPVEALVAASTEVDLVVIGSRGLHGVRALGSVSERVAHQAACSVLVIR